MQAACFYIAAGVLLHNPEAYAFAEANGYKMTSDLYDPAAGEGLCGTKMPWQDRDEFCRVEPGSWPAILAPILLFIGGWWYELRLLWRYFRPQLVLGGAVLTAYQQKWRTENTVVPANTTFMIHRYREFIMLMIGESMLQLVIATHKQEDTVVYASTTSDNTVFYVTKSVDDGHGSTTDEISLLGDEQAVLATGIQQTMRYYTALLSGFVISVCMMHSFHVTEPHHAESHVMQTASFAMRILYQGILMSVKAMATMMAGVGIKLTLYGNLSPEEGKEGDYAADVRLTLGVALAVCFSMTLVMRPLHTPLGLKGYYGSLLWNGARKWLGLQETEEDVKVKEEKIEEQLSTLRNKLKEAKKKSRSGRWTTGKFSNEASESSRSGSFKLMTPSQAAVAVKKKRLTRYADKSRYAPIVLPDGKTKQPTNFEETIAVDGLSRAKRGSLVLGRLALCGLHVLVAFPEDSNPFPSIGSSDLGSGSVDSGSVDSGSVDDSNGSGSGSGLDSNSVLKPWIHILLQAILSLLQFVALSVEMQVASTDRSFPIHHAHHSKEADDDPCHLHSVVPIHEAPRTPVGGGKWGTLRSMAAARELSGSKEKKKQSLGSMPEGQLSSKSRMPSVIVQAVKAHKAKTAPPSAPPSEKMVTDGEPVILSRAGPAPPADEPAPDEAAMSEPVTAEERRQRAAPPPAPPSPPPASEDLVSTEPSYTERRCSGSI